MLSGKKVLITGASSGIGKAISQALLAEGAHVIGLCRSIENLSEGVTPLACDLTVPAEIESAFASLASLDALDVLINNAGIAYLSPITTGDPAQWDRMWKVNVNALGLCSQHALKLFPKSGGHILNISSLSGHRVPPTGGFYAATKFAVRAITDALRAELKLAKSSTRVSSISPGFVDTPLLDQYFEGREDQLSKTRAEVNMLTTKDIAATALHIINSPAGVEINDVQMRSTDQSV
ncbi:SDR family NAD(P)-dependent oxidoreductase [Akkermansiaceae bacterium]|nr:SDR family NAD(P)-dependent oxidoreductase [Akkermansiaceae bacterium]MDB4297953.1 SDR family NAD(P)-dependent oxidoreductase [bacterium]MDA7629631.1 SDR family NAD(P)-dependent oxidoreductase [Akkermansiaceae bacterium]MDA8959861.1 SDR family NAD(P)-dependent oxidoreductase [Akkermansiaceae bacterium]MDB0056721.1 SDR family NAD(P)-dependent oxidoreductase [Akkermansiaceae bacterium]